jgi:hypothetical protein
VTPSKPILTPAVAQDAKTQSKQQKKNQPKTHLSHRIPNIFLLCVFASLRETSSPAFFIFFASLRETSISL